jgi:glycine/D-amino acid oxidase-like deaminating enzyme/nitrite reductase/ring-hydroxylating ferredoxin subunit
MQGSGTTTSVWMATATTPTGNADPHAVRPDVVVIGAGIAGVSTAYFLQRSGKTVLLLDDGKPGDGETGRTTAHLSNAIDDRFTEIERLHGRDGARLAAESHGAAIDAIERLCREEGIACDFTRLDGYLMATPGQDPADLDKELEAAHRAGLTAVEKLDRAPGIDHPGPVLRFPDQGMVHPLKYLTGLVEAFRKRGGMLSTDSHVSSLDETDDGVRVHIDGGVTVEAKAVVVATNAPISDRFSIHSKQAPYRTYAIGVRVAQGALPTALWWDDLDPYHYVRLQPEGDHTVLIVGGEDHKTGEAGDMDTRWARLEAWTRRHFPMAGDVLYRWSGQVMEPFDGLAFIGRDPAWKRHVFVVTGDSGMGMTHGTLAGLMLCELVHGADHPWAGLYDPSRKMIRKLGTYLRENLDAARHMAAAFGASDVETEGEIRPGEGAVMRHFGRPVAAYRDEQGHLHRMSAICPHLKCTVEWNPGEKTWDCPCHGSRFACDGAVLNGPATSALARIEQEVHGRAE